MSKITLAVASDIALDKLASTTSRREFSSRRLCVSASNSRRRAQKGSIFLSPRNRASSGSWLFDVTDSITRGRKTLVDRLKAQGLTPEIIAWKMRLFVPLGDDAVKVVEKLLALYPLLRVGPATRVNS